MSKPRECIVGAGLAGLIAAHAWPRATVMEAAPAPIANHRALLRFRTDAVSTLTGVPFRKVRVRKSIWHNNKHCAADIRLANLYAQKVVGSLAGDRSIWNLEPVDRFIAPEDLYEQLVESVGPRIVWDTKADFEAMAATHKLLVNTAPLPVVLNAMSIAHDVQFVRSPIKVMRYRVKDADVFQTVYFPSPHHSVYRASITGNLLIVEHADGEENGEWQDDVAAAFGLCTRPEYIDTRDQRYGKIVPVDDVWRKQTLFALTNRFNIYSLGRFATWKNILLDDVVHDIGVINALIKNGSSYDRQRAIFGNQ